MPVIKFSLYHRFIMYGNTSRQITLFKIDQTIRNKFYIEGNMNRY